MKPNLIVCAVDFSPKGRAVLTMALRLARWYEAELHVTHLGSRVRSQNKSVTARAVDHELSARLDNFVAGANAEGIKVDTVMLQGDAVSALVDYTRSVSGELILVRSTAVAAAHIGWPERWAKKSAAGPDVRRSPCPTALHRRLVLTRLSRTSSAESTFQSLLRSLWVMRLSSHNRLTPD